MREKLRGKLAETADVIEIGDFPHQRAGLGVQPPGLQEIRLDPAAQGARFAHVENISQCVLEQVDSGVGGEIRGFLCEFHLGSKIESAWARARATFMIAK
jgi:hypothetical protein